MKLKNLPCLFALLLAVSCASAPTSTSPNSKAASSPPDWTTKAVFMEGSNLVFVLNGPLDSDVPKLALPAMTAYLDLPVTADTPVVAAQAVQKFLMTMSSTVPADRFVSSNQAWWKVAVSQNTWNSARAELATLVDDPKADPSVTLERSSDALLQNGRYSEAMTGYVAAALAAVPEGKPGRPARFKACLDKVESVLSLLTLTSATPAQTTQVGKPFGSTFDVRLTYGNGPAAANVVGAPLRFNYLVKKNGRLVTTGQTVNTDALGTVKFELPVPDFAARDAVVVVVDVSPMVAALASVPAEFRTQVSQVETLAGDRKIQLPYTVESASKLVPMTVALADFDDKGSVLRRQETASALIAALQKAGFQVSGIQVNPSLLKSPNDNVILTAWRFQGRTTGRAVYGTVNLVSVTSTDGQFTAEVAGVVKVVDLATGKPVYQLKSTKVASAPDKSSAIAQGFRQWATEAAGEMTDQLP